MTQSSEATDLSGVESRAHQAARSVEDLPIVEELEDPHWGSAADIEALFARPQQGLVRTSGGSLVVYTNADVMALRSHPSVSHFTLEGIMSGFPSDIDLEGFTEFFAIGTFHLRAAEHRPGKQLLSHVMSPRGVTALREGFAANVREVLNEATRRDEVEFSTEVAQRVVASFWKEAVGLDPDQTDELMHLTDVTSQSLRASATREQLVAGNHTSIAFAKMSANHLRQVSEGRNYPFVNQMVAHFDSMGAEYRRMTRSCY